MSSIGRPCSSLDDYLFWQERLASREISGLKVREFCAEEGISRSTYYRWVRQLKDGIPQQVLEEGEDLSTYDSSEPKFVPISVTAPPIEIEFPNGCLVRLPVGIGEAAIVAVTQAVSGLRSRRRLR